MSDQSGGHYGQQGQMRGGGPPPPPPPSQQYYNQHQDHGYMNMYQGGGQGGNPRGQHMQQPPPQHYDNRGYSPPPPPPNHGNMQMRGPPPPPYHQGQGNYQQAPPPPPPPSHMQQGGHMNHPPPPPQQHMRQGPPMSHGMRSHPGNSQQPPPSQSHQQGGQQSHLRWQDDERDRESRRYMIANIVRLLQQRKPDAPREWLQKLPEMAKRLEERLYRYAATKEEYEDRQSLKQRLQHIALKMAEQRPGPSKPGGPTLSPSSMNTGGMARPPNPGEPSGGPAPRGHSSAPAPPPPYGGGNRAPPPPGNNQYQSYPQQGAQSGYAPPPPQYGANNGQYAGRGPPPPPAAPDANASRGPDPRSSSQQQQQRQVLLQQQQRLLVLRHASKCPVQPPNVCPSTPHCKTMKDLWKHIAKCKDQDCQYPHCVSSRYVLAHYHRCTNPNCEVCKPVKDAIRKQGSSQRGPDPFASSVPPPQQQPYPRPPEPAKPAASQMGEQERLIHQLTEERRLAEEKAKIEAQKVKDLEAQMEMLRRQASDGGPTPAAPSAPGGPGPGGKKNIKRQPSSQSQRGRGPKKATQAAAAATAAVAAAGHMPPVPQSHQMTVQQKQHMSHMQAQAQYARVQPPHPPNLSSNISVINVMTHSQIKEHIASLIRFSAYVKPTDLKIKMQTMLRNQQDRPYGYIFQKPVDPIAMDIPDYFEVIKRPMDYSTVKKNIEQGVYRSMNQFADDVRLIYDNAILYNPDTPDGVHAVAKQYAQVFMEDFTSSIKKSKGEEHLKRVSKDKCRLCGTGQYTFEPPVYYCYGKCNQKIKRNAIFYHTPDFKMTWCQACYSSLSDMIPTDDGSEIKKSDVVKKKNSDTSEEAWVQCNSCNTWYHQICVLFNSKNEEAKDAQYFCPMCIMREMERLQQEKLIPPPSTTAQKSLYTAEELKPCKFSEFLERRVRNRVLVERRKQAVRDQVSLSNIPEPGKLTVRVVLNKEAELEPRSQIMKLYKDAPYNYPSLYPHQVKCVVVFQRIDEVDVLFFAMYIQSYGSNCPEPNSRCVYVSYLDSVFYMEPRFLRTPVYQEVIIATLEYEKRRGHTKAFIWACPPLAGDDYILYVHPKEQRTQKAEMLRSWYNKLLEDSRKRGIVVSIDNLYDAYCRRMCNPCGIPYFDGDYWPGVAESFVEELERDKITPTAVNPAGVKKTNRSKVAAKKRASKSKKAKTSKLKKNAGARSGNRSTTRSRSENNDSDDSEEESVPFWPPPEPGDFIEVPQQDALTDKIADCIKQMKDDFFVIYFTHTCAECQRVIDKPDELFWLPIGYEEGMGDLDFAKQKYAPPFALCHQCYLTAYRDSHNGEDPVFEEPPMTSQEVDVNADGELQNIKRKASTSNDDVPDTKRTKEEPNSSQEENAESQEEIKAEPPTDEGNEQSSSQAAENSDENRGDVDGTRRSNRRRSVKANGDFIDIDEVEDETLEEDHLGEDAGDMHKEPTILPEGQSAMPLKSWTIYPVRLEAMEIHRSNVLKATQEPDPFEQNTFFNSRQEFLSLCQGNKYQFDQLRRAKHSTMMVLYHLHNPEDPAFVISCNACTREIKDDSWYKCMQCDEVDFCRDCYTAKKATIHKHECELHTVKSRTNSAAANKMQQQHLNLLFHASTCRDMRCQVENCQKMKQLVEHPKKCQNGGLRNDCRYCKRLFLLLQLHARGCRLPVGTCPVFRCQEFKEKLRRQAQLVQDRRIRAQNDRIHQERMNLNQAANTEAQQQQQQPNSTNMPTNQPQNFSSPTNYQFQLRRGSSGIGKTDRPGKNPVANN